ncbi:MAG: hypothetical protein KC502_02515 [Myxococcales bacterium]|nr:hypothetical protein [Myxococcales bacterium]
MSSPADSLQRALDTAERDATARHQGAKSSGPGGESQTPRNSTTTASGRVSSDAMAHIELEDIGRLGAKVRQIRVNRKQVRDVEEAARTLPHRLANLLPEPVVAVEVDVGLDEAILRTSPENMDRKRFFDLRIRGRGDLVLRRLQVGDDGEREPASWTLTREQLGELVKELA